MTWKRKKRKKSHGFPLRSVFVFPSLAVLSDIARPLCSACSVLFPCFYFHICRFLLLWSWHVFRCYFYSEYIGDHVTNCVTIVELSPRNGFLFCFIFHRDETGEHVNSIPLSLICYEFYWRSGERFQLIVQRKPFYWLITPVMAGEARQKLAIWDRNWAKRVAISVQFYGYFL